jgi:hypothetical protein
MSNDGSCNYFLAKGRGGWASGISKGSTCDSNHVSPQTNSTVTTLPSEAGKARLASRERLELESQDFVFADKWRLASRLGPVTLEVLSDDAPGADRFSGESDGIRCSRKPGPPGGARFGFGANTAAPAPPLLRRRHQQGSKFTGDAAPRTQTPPVSADSAEAYNAADACKDVSAPRSTGFKRAAKGSTCSSSFSTVSQRQACAADDNIGQGGKRDETEGDSDAPIPRRIPKLWRHQKRKRTTTGNLY